MAEQFKKIILFKYSNKSFCVQGYTKPFEKQFKMMWGRYNPNLSCGGGWIFSTKSRLKQVKDFLYLVSEKSEVIKGKLRTPPFPDKVTEYLVDNTEDYSQYSPNLEVNNDHLYEDDFFIENNPNDTLKTIAMFLVVTIFTICSIEYYF